MSKGTYCVAGFDIHNGKIIRPLQVPASNWRLGNQDVIAAGNMVAFEYTGTRGNGSYPHRTEDTVVAGMPRLLEVMKSEDVQAILGGSLKGSIAELYEHQLIEDKFVADGTRCGSLGGVAVPVENIQFEESFGKLRLRLKDNDERMYSLAVTSDELRARFQNAPAAPPDIDGANRWLAGLPEGTRLILRLGLARAWSGKEQNYNPKRCFLQLNGMIAPS